MSIMTESNVYESMVDDGLNQKLCLTATCDASGAFMLIPKNENGARNVMLDATETIDGEKSQIFHDNTVGDAYDCVGESSVYYQEAFNACEEVEVAYKPSLASMMLPVEKTEDRWDKSNSFRGPATDITFEEHLTETLYADGSTNNDEDSDEETIATFLTSAGQRLALYAVENSDEVFAVAVYDGSDEPPTNFQFLMKSDVERLIGEGAVRTIKKPKPMKKQMLNADPPVFAQRNKESNPAKMQLKTEPPEIGNYDDDLYYTCEERTCTSDNVSSGIENVRETKIESSPAPEANVQPDLTCVLMEDGHPTLDVANRKEKIPKPSKKFVSTNRTDFIEQSTVQRILFGDDVSDSDLTLADVEETMKTHKFLPNEKSLLKKISKTIPEPASKNLTANRIITPLYRKPTPNPQNLDNSTSPIVENPPNRSNFPAKLRKIASPARKMTNSLIRKRDCSNVERSTNFAPSGTSLLIPKIEEETIANAIALPRVKRSRKQQLTSVNRDDSEIIIQPANFLSDEDDDEPARKRGRGKRKIGRPTVCKMTRIVTTRKIATRSVRSTPVEVIEIDVDEIDRTPEKNDIVEITIDGNKEKCSSDKENEVIMVGDSEDEAREIETTKIRTKTSNLKCRHCLRNFRQKRGLEVHSRCCPKSPNFERRRGAKTRLPNANKSLVDEEENKNKNTRIKKQYSCKICQAKFDVVVALATHVRSMHSLRKKINSTVRVTEASGEDESKTEVDKGGNKRGRVEETATIAPRKKTKTKMRNSNRMWKSKELHCEDCGRWFSSEALLTAHSLQHATKKSEKQTRRCQTCKKLFKSRLLYIRHMRMHSRAKQLQKKLHQKHQTTGKPTVLRKRGRPRKL